MGQDGVVVLKWKEFSRTNIIVKERESFARTVRFFHKLDCKSHAKYKKLEKLVDILTNPKLEYIMIDKDANKKQKLFVFRYLIDGQLKNFVSKINDGLLISILNSICRKPKDVLKYSDEPIEIMYRPRKEPIVIKM